MGADRLVQGPLNAAGTNPYDQQALIQDIVNNLLEVSGNSRTRRLLRSALLVLPPQTALTNITTGQTLAQLALNPALLNVVNRKVVIRGNLIYSTTATNVATITLTLAFGGTTLCAITTSATNTAASNNLPIQFEFETTTTALGAAGSIESHGWVCAVLGTTAAGQAADFLDTNGGPTTNLNLLASVNLNVYVSASAAIPSMQLRNFTMEMVN